MNERLDTALAHWSYIAPLLTPPANDADFQTLVESLDAILDAGGADESHPLARLAAIVGELVDNYETTRHAMPEAMSSTEALAFLAAEMSTSSIEALASAWARIAEEAKFPTDYEGTATPEAHRASEAIQERIREHIVATNDVRLFGLLHLLGQASLRMEQTLWPEDYERMTREVEEALREANDPNAKLYTHEEVIQAMQERIDRARDEFMNRKVEAGRASMRDGRGKSNDEVEAEFAAKRARAAEGRA